MTNALPLSPRIQSLFTALHHAGDLALPGPLGTQLLHGEAGQERAGTRVQFWLQVQQGRVVAARYRAYGCPYTLAACEWLARQFEGRPINELPPGGPRAWARELDIPAERLGRLLVVEDALRNCLNSDIN